MTICSHGYGPRFKDISGKEFGLLKAVRVSHKKDKPGGGSALYWLCECKCGRVVAVLSGNLHSGHTTSCGCKRLCEIPYSSRSKDYYIWNAMIQRCHNQNTKGYKYYGGRGIKVCDRWRNSLVAFLEDMGQPPTPKHSIDRIDNDRDYEPGNCRWALPEVQANNKRSNRKYTHNGMTLSVAEWSRLTGVSYGTLWRRLVIDKAPFEVAIVPPKTTNRRRRTPAP